MSPVETWCHNLNYYIPDETGATKEFSAENMTRIRKSNTYCSMYGQGRAVICGLRVARTLLVCKRQKRHLATR